MQPRLILQKLPAFNNSKLLIKKNQSVTDIIKALSVAHRQYASDYDKIAKDFLGHNVKQTAFNIWSFLRKNIPYKAEPDSMQTIKSPAAIITTGLLGKKSIYYNDCKNYSLFSGGILSALNRQGHKIPYVYRFASYNLFDKEPSHVFIVIYPDTEKEIWLDAVLKEFNYKKDYQYKTDKNFDQMMYSINGMDDVIAGRRAKRQQRKAARKQRRAKRRAEGRTFGKRLVKTIKKVGKAVLKVAAAPVRNSFLLLVKLNFRSLATNLQKAINKAPSRVREFWEGAGGRYQNLITAVNQGSKKRRLGEIGLSASIGAAPAAAAASTAAPLLIKVAALLKKLGINEQFVGDMAKKLIENKVEKVLERAETQSEGTEAAVDQAAETIEQQTEAPATASNNFNARLRNQSAVKLTNEAGQEVVPAGSGSGSGINKNILIFGGLGVAALLLLKKK
jgi:hypothetical protein